MTSCATQSSASIQSTVSSDFFFFWERERERERDRPREVISCGRTADMMHGELSARVQSKLLMAINFKLFLITFADCCFGFPRLVRPVAFWYESSLRRLPVTSVAPSWLLLELLGVQFVQSKYDLWFVICHLKCRIQVIAFCLFSGVYCGHHHHHHLS